MTSPVRQDETAARTLFTTLSLVRRGETAVHAFLVVALSASCGGYPYAERRCIIAILAKVSSSDVEAVRSLRSCISTAEFLSSQTITFSAS